MLDYVIPGTRPQATACAFYDARMVSIGFGQLFDDGKPIIQDNGLVEAVIGISTPFSDKAAPADNGVMVAMPMKSTQDMDTFYKKTRAPGAADDGAPVPRITGFYAGYLRDLDGNKLNALYPG